MTFTIACPLGISMSCIAFLVLAMTSIAQAQELQAWGVPSGVSVSNADLSASSLPAGRKMLQIGALQAAACKQACQLTPKSPVCSTKKKTYVNQCYAICNNEKVAYLGGCVAKPCLCPPLFSLVCGGGKTYLSPCFAECAGVKSYKEGTCAADCSCPDTSLPVCGTDGKDYGNICKAACAGVGLVYSGKCDERVGEETPCKCSYTYDPVCASSVQETVLPPPLKGVIKTPITTTYQNPCFAQCAKAKTWTKGACKDYILYESKAWWCGCPLNFKPVCGSIVGVNSTLNNKCTAECLGFKVLYDGICKDCICPQKTNPVCVGKKTYRTACDARCKGGATTWTKGSCGTPCSKCPAPTVTSYVCGVDGLPYGNACLAECVGTAIKSQGFCSVVSLPSLGK